MAHTNIQAHGQQGGYEDDGQKIDVKSRQERGCQKQNHKNRNADAK
jgi:hypothetical protein